MNNIAILNTCICGSTGKIAVGLFNYLQNNGYNVYFCYGRENGPIQTNYYHIGSKLTTYLHAGLTRITGLQGFGSVMSTIKLILFLESKKIDLLYIISPHGYYLNEKIIYNFASKKKLSIVYVMIDEYAFRGKCGYSDGCRSFLTGCHKCPKLKESPKSLFNGAPYIYKMKAKAYSSIDSIVFVGPEYTVKQAAESPLLKRKKCVVLDEAINTSFFSPRDTSKLKQNLKIADDKIVLVCVAPFSNERKGCIFFLELAKRFKADERFVFIQVGFNVDPRSVDIPSNYIPIGFLSDQNLLAQYYSLADLFVFPSLLDTMPNTCLEALSCGSPLLLFNVSGMPYIADETVAVFVEAKNVDQMVDAVKRIQKKTDKQIRICREYALKRYNGERYNQKLVEIAKNT